MNHCEDCKLRAREEETGFAYCMVRKVKIWLHSVACKEYDPYGVF